MLYEQFALVIEPKNGCSVVDQCSSVRGNGVDGERGGQSTPGTVVAIAVV